MNAGSPPCRPTGDHHDAGPPGPPDPDPSRARAAWFLPGRPAVPAAPVAPAAPGREEGIAPAWARAEAAQAARLARVAARIGALDDRLSRGPEGWRRRLALIQAADLSWATGERIGADRLALWLALRAGAAGEDAGALERAAWAARRLTGGPGPEAGLLPFLGRVEAAAEGPALAERVAALAAVLESGADLHPVTRGAMLLSLWPLAGIGRAGDLMEGAVVALRLAAAEGQGGAVFAPLATPALRPGGTVPERLTRWLDGLEQGLIAAQRRLDSVEAWQARALAATAGLSGRTPGRLIAALAAWPVLSAPMAERLTGASRAAVQRNLALLETRGLLREITGQGRFRFWTAD